MASGEDDFFSFAVSNPVGAAPRPAPGPVPVPAPGTRPPVSPVPAPPLFQLAPESQGAPTEPAARQTQPRDTHDGAYGDDDTSSSPLLPRVAAVVAVGVLALGVFLLIPRGAATSAATGGARYDAVPRAAAQRVTTPAGDVLVPGRGRITAAQDVVLDLDATAELRRVVCTVQAGELVVLTNVEQDAQGPRVRISSGAVGCAGWLRATALAPE